MPVPCSRVARTTVAARHRPWTVKPQNPRQSGLFWASVLAARRWVPSNLARVLRNLLRVVRNLARVLRNLTRFPRNLARVVRNWVRFAGNLTRVPRNLSRFPRTPHRVAAPRSPALRPARAAQADAMGKADARRQAPCGGPGGEWGRRPAARTHRPTGRDAPRTRRRGRPPYARPANGREARWDALSRWLRALRQRPPPPGRKPLMDNPPPTGLNCRVNNLTTFSPPRSSLT